MTLDKTTQAGTRVATTTKFAKRARWIVIIAVLAILIGIITFPMRMAIAWAGLDNGPLTMRGAAGSVWDGTLYSAALGPVQLGDVDAELQPWALLSGQTKLALTLPGGSAQSATGRATMVRSGAGFGIIDMTGAVPVGQWLAPLPAPIANFEQFSVRFANGQCAEAGGLVKLQMPALMPGLSLSNGLTAAPRCSGDRVLLPFKGQSGMEQVNLYVAADGAYRATLRLEGLPEIAAPVVQARGFRQDGAAWELAVEGRF